MKINNGTAGLGLGLGLALALNVKEDLHSYRHDYAVL